MKGCPTCPRKLYASLMLAPVLAMLPTISSAQDQPVTTERQKSVPAPYFGEQTLSAATISTQPRYYLDTIDNLNRIVTDESRSAPGLTKNNYLTKTYPVLNTEAIHLQTYLLRSLAYEGGVAEVMGADGVKDGDGKGVQYLVVTAPDFMIPGIDEFVSLADKEGFKFFDATGKDFGGGSGAVK